LDKNSEPGIYTLHPKEEGGKFDLMYTFEERRIRDRLLLELNPADTIEVKGLRFKLNEDFVNTWEGEDLSFRVTRFDVAVDWLREATSYKWLDRYTWTNLVVMAFHRNPEMAADIANALAQNFVEFDKKMSSSRVDEVLEILEKELAAAELELNEANNQLQAFREQNPRVVFTAGAGGGGVDQITNLENQRASVGTIINDLNNSISQVNSIGDMSQKLVAARELLTFVAAEGVPVASAYSTEFEELSQERDRQIGQYAPTHPLVQELDGKFRALIGKIVNAAQDHISKLSNRQSNLSANIRRENNTLRSLPEKERRLAELTIDRDVKKDIYERVLSRYNATKINQQVEVGNIVVLDEAVAPPPESLLALFLKKSILGIGFGLGLGVVLAIILEFFNKTVQDKEELQSRLRIPVLGTVPLIESANENSDNIKDLKGKRDAKLITLDYSPTLESESYRDLRTKILFANSDKPISSFLLTSLRPSEGKSLTSSNLAVTFAQQKISTLIIDADLRRGVLHNVFGNKKKPGLSDFLISKATVDYDNVNKLIQKTMIPNLYIITTGSPIPNPTEMLGSERMANLVSMLKSRFGMLIIDTAPFQASSDAAILSSQVDGVTVVVRADYTNVDQLKDKIHEYPNIEQRILGLVLNMVKVDSKNQRYQYSYYNY
ncbi:MAG: polysaccharide biosynthesis tyrosine autokinase, partial [Calditrichaeota bacterium]|nr:polysaccharide biosynthesis tyrosine autokinase [Calditrichota bacterium]